MTRVKKAIKLSGPNEEQETPVSPTLSPAAPGHAFKDAAAGDPPVTFYHASDDAPHLNGSGSKPGSSGRSIGGRLRAKSAKRRMKMRLMAIKTVGPSSAAVNVTPNDGGESPNGGTTEYWEFPEMRLSSPPNGATRADSNNMSYPVTPSDVMNPGSNADPVGDQTTHSGGGQLALTHPAVWRSMAGMAHPPPCGPSSSTRTTEQAGPSSAPSELPAFRFWIDEQCIKSPTSVQLVQRLLHSLGGVRTGGPPKRLGPVPVYGYMHLPDWDLLWTVTKKGMHTASKGLMPGQVMCIIPGMALISRKSNMHATLSQLRGHCTCGPDGLQPCSHHIMPLSFSIPGGLADWRQWLQQHEDPGVWILKNNQQRGNGLKLVTTTEAAKAVKERTVRRDSRRETHKWLILQQYVMQPMLIQQRKFGIRVWVVITSIQPNMRAYLHRNGLILFSSSEYSGTEALSNPDGGGIAPGHVTNYAQNEGTEVWNLDRLKSYLPPAMFAAAWSQIRHAAAALCRTAHPALLDSCTKLNVPRHAAFQFLGLDFLLDAVGRVWLLEANATPSLAVEHADPAVRELIREQKTGFVVDMLRILGIPQRFQGLWPLDDADMARQAEYGALGGFEELRLEAVEMAVPS